uniref:Exonuclease 1 n=1 Tax=Salarias fasciatus TaxID=181472 RepID=A0A672HQ98_SALFA
MGISGLLQFIKDAAEPVSVKKYRGQTVAVDTYCWLHKGAFSCAEKLAKGEPTDQYVWYCMKFVDMLLGFGVKPVLVFDGRNLPSKKEVEKARRERRELNLQRGRQLLREGKLSEARDCFTRCVNVTPSMAHRVIQAARTRGVDCIVAPYEADAQLAFLSKSGLAQAVITEDSDLLAFGCRKVILKMDKQGNGLEVDRDHLGRCRSLGNVFTPDKFRYMCILAGCDYLASLHGIGLGKACKLLRLAQDPDILKVVRKMGQYLKMSLQVPDSYVQGFVKANNTFLYQLVFDPVQRRVVPLNPYPEHLDPSSLAYAGPNLGDETGLQLALGNLDLHTLEQIDDFSPDRPGSCRPRSQSWNQNQAPAPPGGSIWSRGCTSAPAAQTTAAPASPRRPPPTRGQQSAVRPPCRELQVKRPREDSGVSDQDEVVWPSGSSQPRPRNRFATVLQRRNQEAEGGHEETQSPSEAPPPAQPTEDQSCSSSDGPDAPSVETPSPPVSPSSPPPPESPPSPPPGPPSQGLRLFPWSSSPPPGSGLASLKQFQYKKESSSPAGGSSPPHSRPDDADDPPASQDSAYFSQSQPQLPPLHREDGPPHGGSLQEDVGPRVSSGPHVSRVGLTRVQKLGPARASGLRKRPSSANNENRPGVQATISGLWSSFSFRRYGRVLAVWPLGPAVEECWPSFPVSVRREHETGTSRNRILLIAGR